MLAIAAKDDCWETCRTTGFFCEVFCCQPLDGTGNPSCWDEAGHFTFPRCCLTSDVQALVAPPEPAAPPRIAIGRVRLELYRGPVDHNSPRINERTLEIALGLWFMRRCVSKLYKAGGGYVPTEIGNVLAAYWPKEERLWGHVLPWQVFDLSDNGQDATYANFTGSQVLSISTVEHVGYDNEGTERVEGYRVGISERGLEDWVRAWSAAAALLTRIVDEAAEFLVTFPLGFNPHLDAAVARSPRLRPLARVARRVDAFNRWEFEPRSDFRYAYDFRDIYTAEHVGLIYDPRLPGAYERVFGEAMLLPPLQPPMHPPFRFANAVCVVTNAPELLA